MTHDLPCRAVAARATDYLEGALGPATRVRLEAHLAACPGCRHFVNQLRLTVRLLGLLPSLDGLDGRPLA